jgi:hypothetical protein
MTTQVNAARMAEPTPPEQQAHSTRLLYRWCELTALVATAAAHHPGEEFELFTAQQQVELALRQRSQKASQVLDDLIHWETQISHHPSGAVLAELCLTCRRAHVDATLLPAQFGGAL